MNSVNFLGAFPNEIKPQFLRCCKHSCVPNPFLAIKVFSFFSCFEKSFHNIFFSWLFTTKLCSGYGKFSINSPQPNNHEIQPNSIALLCLLYHSAAICFLQSCTTSSCRWCIKQIKYVKQKRCTRIFFPGNHSVAYSAHQL